VAQNPLTQRDWDDARLINAALDIHADDPAFRYRFIAYELSDRGISAGQNRVARLCSQRRIWSVFVKKCGLAAGQALQCTTTLSADNSARPGRSGPVLDTSEASDRSVRTPGQISPTVGNGAGSFGNPD
jgi:hypothetical protein